MLVTRLKLELEVGFVTEYAKRKFITDSRFASEYGIRMSFSCYLVTTVELTDLRFTIGPFLNKYNSFSVAPG